jgi:uncharacterized protein (TIGR03083 family)
MCTAELAEIVSGDLARPVPTCPEWTFRQLATHVGRGHRWAAEIVATRAAEAIPLRQVPDGKLPDDPARHVEWLNAAAARLIAAVTAAGGDLVWTFLGPGPAGFWARRRAHEAAVHLADAQLATSRDVDLAADLAADGIDEWLGLVAAGTERTTELARAHSQPIRGDGHTLHLHASDDGLDGTGEWLVRRTPSRITVEPGHAWAALRASTATASAVSAPAASAAAIPATTCPFAMARCSSSTSIRVRVPAASPWALRTAAHQASWTGVNFPTARACSSAVAPGLRSSASR